MTDFFEELERAADEPDEPEPAPPPWDDVLDTFVSFLNTKYADALRASRRGGAAPGVVQLVVSPRGHRNHQNTILVLHVTRTTASVLGENSDEIPNPEALRRRLAHMIRTTAFRQTVATLRTMSQQPVTGVLHGGGLRDRRPSTDVLVTLSPEEQIRLADASEAANREPLTLRGKLLGPSVAGKGIYDRNAVLRWLVAGGYGLELDARDGHDLEGGEIIRLHGVPVMPSDLG